MIFSPSAPSIKAGFSRESNVIDLPFRYAFTEIHEGIFLLFMFYNPVYDNLKQHTDVASHSKFTIYCCHLLASGRSVTVARRHKKHNKTGNLQKQASPFDAALFASYCYVIKTSSCFMFPTLAHSAETEFREKQPQRSRRRRF